MLSPHVAELVGLIVQVHTASGGTEPAKLRELVSGACQIATLDGICDGFNRISAGMQTQALMARIAS